MGILADWWHRMRFGPTRTARPERRGGGDDADLAQIIAQARAAAAVPDRGREDITRLIALQRAYWTPAPDEKAALIAREGDLVGAELLRLHHLVCLDLLATIDEQGDDDRARCAALADRLAAPDSPYRPRQAVVIWPRAEGRPDRHQTGRLQNASASHVGALEVVRYQGDEPTRLDFIPFDDLKTVTLGRGAPFRAAFVELEDVDAEPLTVRLPTLYGPSWASEEDLLRDGSLTMFPVHLDGGHQLGLGTQDLSLDGDGARALVGITSPAFLRFLR